MKKAILSICKHFILAVLAGVAISIGCLAFLSAGADNKILGALFFTVGLFVVLAFGFNLYTGKVCYAFDNEPAYSARLPVIWAGNFVGAFLAGIAARATRLSSLQAYCNAIVSVKTGDDLLSLFILGILCNILIFVAVHGWANFKSPVLKVLAVFFGVSVFVLCGFEHCVADMFYFTFADAWSLDSFGLILMITLGNSVGGVSIPLLLKLVKSIEKQKKEEKAEGGEEKPAENDQTKEA